MVPLRDRNPTVLTPVVTYIILGINVLVFLYELTLNPADLQAFFETWAVIPSQLTAAMAGQMTDPGRPPEWITLITAQFLHGGFFHIAGNMLFLWVFGNNVEDRLGHSRFPIFYLGCGALASLAQWYFDPASSIPSLGASGAIAGVLGAYILRFPKARVLTLVPLGFFWPTFELPAWVFLGFWFVQQAFYGVVSLNVSTTIGMESGGIAYWAHAGGFVVGGVLGPIFGLFGERSPYDKAYTEE